MGFLESFPSEEFKSLFYNNPDAIFTLNTDGCITAINKKTTELLGYTLYDIKKLKEKVLYSSYETFQYHKNKAMQGTPTSFDAILIDKEGVHIPVHLTFIPNVLDRDNVFFFGLCKDMRSIKNYEEKLATVYDNLEQAQRISNIGSWDYNVVNDKGFWSKQTYRIFGIDDFNFVPEWDTFMKFVHPKDQKGAQAAFDKVLATGVDEVSHEHRVLRMDGEERTVIHRVNVIANEEGQVVRLIGTIQDITENKELSEKLEESKTQFQLIADRLYAAIWSFDVIKERVSFCSQGVKDIYGIPAHEFMENAVSWVEFVHPDDQQVVRERQQKLWRGEELVHQYRIIDRHGQVKWIQDQTIPFLNLEGDVIRLDGIVTDITDEKRAAEALAFVADHDFLTKLPNRRYFERQLNELISRSKREKKHFAVFFLDLDRFKYINDTLGHEMGDRLLIAVSERLKNLLGEDAFLARIGGDEFTICVKGPNGIGGLIEKGKSVVGELEKPFNLDDYELYTTTSMGISIFPLDGEDSHTLLKNADRALYKTKELGRNGWQVYSSSLNVQSLKTYQLENDLRKALRNKEFFLEYQPKVDAKTGRIEGAEALIRWNHPEWGIVPPGEFIPIAEDTGFIFKMADWVVKKVCSLIERWQKEGISVVPISINVSPKRLLKADFVKSIKEVIEGAGINPGLIELELTEGTILRNTETTKSIITDLKDYGVKFSLDDFGTGYSSLSYLMNLDIDTLKIDKSFIDGIGINKVNEGIIKSVIFLSKELGINVIAEGVELMEQLNFLLQQECPQIQGYIFSRPVTDVELRKLLIKKMLNPVPIKRAETIVGVGNKQT